jgi:hypothetical protein
VLNGQIPEHFKDFLKIESILDDFIDDFVGKPIDEGQYLTICLRIYF